MQQPQRQSASRRLPLPALLAKGLAVLCLAGLAAAAQAAERAVVSRVPVSYPPIAKQMHMTGDVIVVATVDASGKVVAAASTSPYKMLVPAALDAVRHWKFAPSGETSTESIVIRFALDQ